MGWARQNGRTRPRRGEGTKAWGLSGRRLSLFLSLSQQFPLLSPCCLAAGETQGPEEPYTTPARSPPPRAPKPSPRASLGSSGNLERKKPTPSLVEVPQPKPRLHQSPPKTDLDRSSVGEPRLTGACWEAMVTERVPCSDFLQYCTTSSGPFRGRARGTVLRTRAFPGWFDQEIRKFLLGTKLMITPVVLKTPVCACVCVSRLVGNAEPSEAFNVKRGLWCP